MQISTQTDNHNQRNFILRKMGLKFGNPNFDILRKIAFMKNHMWLIKELVIWDRLARKAAGSFSATGWENDKCHLQENF